MSRVDNFIYKQLKTPLAQEHIAIEHIIMIDSYGIFFPLGYCSHIAFVYCFGRLRLSSDIYKM